MTQDGATTEPLMYEEPALRRLFRRPAATIREWMEAGHLPARRLPDGRVVVLREELLEMLRSLPRP
jgi:hypothetical protein